MFFAQLASMASYVLARYNSRFYKVMYSLFISGVLVPFQCIMLLCMSTSTTWDWPAQI